MLSFFISHFVFRRQPADFFVFKKFVKWKQVKITITILQRPEVLYRFGGRHNLPAGCNSICCNSGGRGGGAWAPGTPLPAPLGFIDDNDDGSTMGSPQRKNPYGVNQILAEPVLSKVRSYRNHKRIKDFTSLVKGLRAAHMRLAVYVQTLLQQQ